jgi:hypothetical protein
MTGRKFSMRFLVATILLGPLIFISTLPTSAQPAPSSDRGATVQWVADSNSSTDRDTYLGDARRKTAEWQQKMDELNRKADANGQAAAVAVEGDVNQAWDKVKVASHRLETVGAEGWEEAKTSFEKASHELAAAWHKRHPEEK